ncbi:MAG: DUF1552 domain-containing protein [Acidobacteria bacterium]|nr:DUF1552 domain-containing protein [Acidobacteriota bacterium]
MILGKTLSRRTVLRGAGASLALPLLQAMLPTRGEAKRLSALTKTRMVAIYIPNGTIPEKWKPTEEGADYALSYALEPLEPFRKDFSCLSGLAQDAARAHGDGAGDHARAAASYLTGVHPKKTAGSDIRNGVSFDQIAARAIGRDSRLPSLELGLDEGAKAGNCDSGYTCAYTNNISWKSETQPLPPIVNPRIAFERLFGDIEGPMDEQALARRRADKTSLLDLVQEQTRRLQGDLGQTDRRKLDEYLESIREIEQRIAVAEQAGDAVIPTMDKPAGVPVTFADHSRLLFDLIKVAFETDMTRVVTLMFGKEGSNRTYGEIGISGAHHGMSHHKQDPEKIRQLVEINRYHVEQLAYFLGRLKTTPDAEGSLLDNAMVLYGGGIRDGNRHDNGDLPALLAGRAGGRLSPGRHIRYRDETPMANLFVTMLAQMGVETEAVGNSSGRLEGLTDL